MGPISNQEKVHVANASNPVGGGLNWREWKKQKKEQHKKWNEAKIKKMKEKKEKKPEIVELDDAADSCSKGRNYTVSIALPGSILDNAQTAELRAYLAGQIARAAAVFSVDEIVVFDETGITSQIPDIDNVPLKLNRKNEGCIQLVKILQFLECPQYLRKYLFPLHPDLESADLLNPLCTPHHLRIDEISRYREGVVLKHEVKGGKGSCVDIGLKKTAIIDQCLQSNVRVTVKLDKEQPLKRRLKGSCVSPSMPMREDGIYWGYSVRLAKGLGTVLSECPYKGGYDLTIGTSENGTEVDSFIPKEFKHFLIVFGGVKGLEASLEADENLNVEEPSLLFDHYLNTLPGQGSRTIRTEEAILISMSILRPKILESQKSV